MRILKYVVTLLLTQGSRGLAGRPDDTETSISYKKYSQVNTGFANLQSLIRPAPANIQIRRRKYKNQPRIETSFRDPAKYIPSNVKKNTRKNTQYQGGKNKQQMSNKQENTRKYTQHQRGKSKRKMPKIYITKLPVKMHNIFFAEQIKEKENSVTDIIGGWAETMGDNSSTIRNYNFTNLDKDQAVISNDVLEPAMRSDQQYENSVENVNDMIYNSQVVNQPSNLVKSLNDKQDINVYSTEYPYLEYLPNTVKIDAKDHNEPEYNVSKKFEKDQKKEIWLGGADRIQPSLPSSISDYFKEDDWVMPVLIIAILSIVGIIFFEVIYIINYLRKKHRMANVFLDHVLIGSLLCCAVVSILYTLQPTTTICSVSRFMTSMSCTLVFSTIMVKLLYSVTRHRRGHLHTTYQVILLSCSLLVQTVILTQRLVTTTTTIPVNHSCVTSFHQQLYGNAYNIFLIALLTILSIVFRREAFFAPIMMVISVIIWSTWIIAWYLAPSHYQDLANITGLLATTIAVFGVVFFYRGSWFFVKKRKEGFIADNEDLNNRQDTSSPSALSVDLSNISLFPIERGKIDTKRTLIDKITIFHKRSRKLLFKISSKDFQ